jgi:hypothetical protein
MVTPPSAPASAHQPPHPPARPPARPPRRRRVYDATGSVAASEELTGDSFADLRRYYREVYAPVTPEAVDAFYLAYRGGAEERADLLREYAAAAGDMGRVFARVMCSDEAADARRFMDTIEAAIAGGEAERHARYARWAARVAKAPRPADPLGAAGVSGSGGASGSGAAPGAKGKGRKKAAAAGGDVDLALVAQLQARRSAVGGAFLDALAAKYGAPPAGAGEPSEAEFAAAAACVTARAKGKGKGKAGEGGGKAAAPKRAKKG